MKVFLSGINPSLDVEGKLRELGHEPVLTDRQDVRKGSEGSSKPLIKDSEAVICDMSVRKGIEDHRYAYSIGKPVLSLRDEKYKDFPLSPNIELMSTLAHYSGDEGMKLEIEKFLNGGTKSIEAESSPSKERR